MNIFKKQMKPRGDNGGGERLKEVVGAIDRDSAINFCVGILGSIENNRKIAAAIVDAVLYSQNEGTSILRKRVRGALNEFAPLQETVKDDILENAIEAVRRKLDK